MTRRTFCTGLGLLTLALASAAYSGETKKPAQLAPESAQFFENRIRPLLAETCFRCHGEKNRKGNLRLDSRAAILTGGDRGPALVPGHPEKSLLVQAIQHDNDELKMPPTQKLAREKIADLTRWIQMGAPWPGAEQHAIAPPKSGEYQISAKDRAHWAFQPVKRPPVPTVKNGAWIANPIDAFILAGLEAKGLQPNPPASRQELLRRVYYDLTGLPPSPHEVAAFLADSSPRAYEDLVDRLLGSPHYGEKWARHWLDLVRFAETNSYERDNPKPHAWRYRDYVIRAFNQDKPYDQFIREQLAGDELPNPDADAIIATGYYRLGIWDDEPSDPAQARYDGLDDIVATTGQVFLGLTVDCARCHDHKIDPIPQKDYYRLLAFFHNINHFRNGGPTDERPILPTPEARKLYEGRLREREEKLNRLEDEIKAVVGDDNPDKLSGGRAAAYKKLRKQFAALKRQPVAEEMALCVSEAGRKAPDTFVLLRGNPHVKGAKVEPAFPMIFDEPAPALPEPAVDAKSSGRRRVLADWIASKDNRLTVRVMANRVWQNHFGRGIVRTPNDFGLHGSRPTHPELLDWLASEFAGQGWRLKSMHRLILTSNTYRMSSRGNDKALSPDPANDLFWRFDMRRLSAEEIRDSLLAVSGCLNPKMYGPGVFPEIPKEVLAGQSMPGRGWGKSPPEEQNRRSIYVHVKRSLLLPILESFDLAEADRSTPVRFVTTQPMQALAMVNGDFLNKQAAIFAERLKRDAGEDVAKQVRLGLFLATARQPGEQEIRRGVRLIETLRREDGASPEQALRYFCLMVFNLNEFLYLD
jgi:cytochrome c553